jgi:hypothetical protein
MKLREIRQARSVPTPCKGYLTIHSTGISNISHLKKKLNRQGGFILETVVNLLYTIPYFTFHMHPLFHAGYLSLI